MKYISRIKTMVVCPSGEALFSECCTEISITDEASGEFIEITQSGAIRDGNSIFINPEEWPKLRETIDMMVKECREDLCS